MFDTLTQSLATGQFNGPFALFVILATLWAIPWKGVALWKSAQRGQTWWFIALLVINTLAILEIFYIFFVVPRHDKKQQEVVVEQDDKTTY